MQDGSDSGGGDTGPGLPRLETSRAVLRTPRMADRDALMDVFGDPRVTRYWSSPPLPDEAAAVRLLENMAEGRRTGRLHQWALARRTDDRLIGTVTLAAIDRGNRRADLGYALGHAWWGGGWMAEALMAVVEHAFGTMKLHRLEADVDPRNIASIRRLEALGFRQEGLLRDRWYVQGEVQDSALFGLLATDRPGHDAGAGDDPR